MTGLERRGSFLRRLRVDLRKNWTIYLLVLPVIIYYIIFCYKPMYGLLLAFKNYRPKLGIIGSPWTSQYGLKHFIDFFGSMHLPRLVRNTIMLSVFDFLFSFPAPILLALLLNELGNERYKKIVQTISYFPHFISTVVICGLLAQFCSSSGVFNDLRALVGMKRIPLLQQPGMFRSLYIGSGIWQGVGWGSIIYLAAMAGADPQLYEAAALDGAGRLRRMWHVTLPAIRNTIVILIIMNSAHILNVGSEKILLLYNPTIYETADVISTFVYRRGLVDGNYSYSTAVGLLNSIISLILVLICNKISDRVAEFSLF